MRDRVCCNITGMAGSMGQAGMGSYYSPAAAYGPLSAASMAAAAAAAAQQSAAAMSAGLGAPAQVSRYLFPASEIRARRQVHRGN